MIHYGRHTTNWRDAWAVARQVHSKSLTQGPKIQEFEYAVAKRVGAQFAVAVSSATAGLHLALLALELRPGSEVLTSPISFVSSSNAALYCQLNPKFIDIDPDTLNISIPATIQELSVNGNIGAVIPVHMGGAPCELEELSKMASKLGVGIIEDAAHGLGGFYPNGKPIGSCCHSDMTVFSFHPVKSVTTGEGGVITTNNKELYKKLLLLRSHGITGDSDTSTDQMFGFTQGIENIWYHEMRTLGYHYRLSEIQAALGVSQIKKLKKFIKKRSVIANQYDSLLKDIPYIELTQTAFRTISAHHLYIVKLDFSRLEKSRNAIMRELRALGIGSQVHYKPIPLNPYYKFLGYQTSHLPNAMDYYSRCLSIPIYPKLSLRKQHKIVKSLIKVCSAE